jgi:hypothetical protein
VGFGSGVRELARKPEEWDVEARVVLVRARDRCLELHCGFSTATVRWRPSRAPAAVARANKDNGEGTRAGLEVRMTRGRWRSRRWTAAAGGAAPAAGGSRAEEAEKQKGFRGRRKGRKVQGLMSKIEKIQGLPCKVKFPIDLKL